MKKLYYLCLILFSLMACSSSAKSDDENNEKTKIGIIRFDKDFYEYLNNSSDQAATKLRSKHATLIDAFCQTVLEKKIDNQSDCLNAISSYFSHPMLLNIYKYTEATYRDVQGIEKEVEEVSNRLTNLIPRKSLPQFSMHVSGFKENIIVMDNCISVSIDKYLGENYSAYQKFFDDYQRQQMSKDFIVRDYLKAFILSDNFIGQPDDKTLLATMVREGKILYLLSELLPDYREDRLMGYTPNQMRWCKAEEKNIWAKIVKQNHLYSKDYMLIYKYIDDASFTAPLSTLSPGRVASWIGYKIVSAYAKESKKNMTDLLKVDSQTILKESNYKP